MFCADTSGVTGSNSLLANNIGTLVFTLKSPWYTSTAGIFQRVQTVWPKTCTSPNALLMFCSVFACGSHASNVSVRGILSEHLIPCALPTGCAFSALEGSAVRSSVNRVAFLHSAASIIAEMLGQLLGT